MTRRIIALAWLIVFAGIAEAQPGTYRPLPVGDTDPEALKRLAAMLGKGDQPGDQPKLDPKMMELLEKFLKNAAPEQKQQLLDSARKQAQDNPKQFEKQFQQSNPNASPDDLKRLMDSLGKPGDPVPSLPKPGPTPPISSKPIGTPSKPIGTSPKPNPIPQPPPRPSGTNPTPPPNKLDPVQNQNPWEAKKPNPNAESVQGAVQAWESTVGPIDSTPAVKDAIVDLFGNGTGKPGDNGKPFWDNPDFNGTDGSNNTGQSGFWKFMTGGSGSNWTSPGWMKNWSTPSASTPSAPKTNISGPNAPSLGGIGSVGGIAGLGSAGTVILILIIAAVVAFLVWKFLPAFREARRNRLQSLPGQGPWPVDPRTIRDREGLVIAFEYLSILVCGNGAVVWNHVTIAEALRAALPEKEHLAEPLARLYAVARYTPMNEEIPESAYAEARNCLCRLAGVDEV